jgi:hypothetical protein
MGDRNAPVMRVVPFWGADGYSIRTAIRNALRANPFPAARSGVGVRPAPSGASVTEGTKTDAWFGNPQQYAGTVVKVANPTLKNTTLVPTFPAASVAVKPWLTEWSNAQLNGM